MCECFIICTYVHVCTCMCVHVCVHVCVYMYVYMYVCTCMYMHVCTYMYVHACVYVHVCTCMCVHVCTCMYVHAEGAVVEATLDNGADGIMEGDEGEGWEVGDDELELPADLVSHVTCAHASNCIMTGWFHMQEPDLGGGGAGEEGYYVTPTKGTSQAQVGYCAYVRTYIHD